jgi:hypothetical protein
MDDIVWWVVNTIFTAILWLLLDEEGEKVATVLWITTIVVLISLLIKVWSNDED